MQNAAILFHADAYDTTTSRLLGRHSAAESFLRGFMRHAEIDELVLWNAANRPLDEVNALLGAIGETRTPVRWLGAADRAGIGATGILNFPAPNISEETWRRRAVGPRSYAICGITHTTATARVMNLVSDLLIAPCEAYDTLICTSNAVRASVETQLNGVRDFLTAEYGPRRRPEPQRATIPLGVNTADFTITPEQRKSWRDRLDIPADAAVALYVGRFNVREKMNPALMALALEKSAQALGRPIYWVNSGWAEDEQSARLYHEQTRALCPSVTYIHLDGRPAEVRFSIWSVADFFISFSDNIQETFGLTPVEAMAAGLPCVVTDWDGYKDTVRHGLDGFRVPTTTPGPGGGRDLAFWFANEWISFTNYAGAAAQYTAIDYDAAVTAISALVLDGELRQRMGAQAKAQARAVFDWSAIIPQYQALWAEQNARRLAAAPEAPSPDNPFRPEPFILFQGYPTRHLSLEDRITAAPGLTWPEAAERLAADIVVYSRLNRPNEAEVEQIFRWLTEHPGARVRDLVQIFPSNRQPWIQRGVLWLARYGVIGIAPAG